MDYKKRGSFLSCGSSLCYLCSIFLWAKNISAYDVAVIEIFLINIFTRNRTEIFLSAISLLNVYIDPYDRGSSLFDLDITRTALILFNTQRGCFMWFYSRFILS